MTINLLHCSSRELCNYSHATYGSFIKCSTVRWAEHHEDGIQQSYFNGAGFESWENVWGIWNGITERDGEAIRRTSAILRQFSDLVQGGDWVPHVVISEDDNMVYTSQFSDQAQSIWLMVNRDPDNDVNMTVTLDCFVGATLIDVYHGVTLTGCSHQGLNIEANGYGALLMTPGMDEDLVLFLEDMREMTSKPLADYNDEWSPLPQIMEDSANFVDYIADKPGQVKQELDTIYVEGGFYNFFTLANCIEGDRLPNSVGVQFPWETHPGRSHQHLMEIVPFTATKYPITNEQYKTFLNESGWQPQDPHNWLKHWKGSTSYPAGHDKKPVTWVSVRDAETFCSYYNMQTPTAWQWQWMAQGPTNLNYPWGDDPDPARVPEFSSDRDMPAPDDVDAHPTGSSWCGAEDLVGNVYSWTRVFTDEHTSRAVIRGGSRWRPDGSHWYQPATVVLGPVKEHNTYLLMSDSLDRSGGVGFRCVAEQL